MIHVAYDDRLLKWKLGKNHPTNPIRAKYAVQQLCDALPGNVTVNAISREANAADLIAVHDLEYVSTSKAGINDEWYGRRPDLDSVARLMFQGTVDLTLDMLDGRARYGFSPQGAKHHAMRDRGSGFCVYNDFAWSALRFVASGHRVLYLDTDAHHGDGVEALTRDCPNVLTASIHDGTIFPGTGREHEPERRVYNWSLVAESGDDVFARSVNAALEVAHDFQPTVLLWAIGGDGYKDDPLSSLQYTYRGYRAVAKVVGAYAGLRDMPVLFGGAGGYLPTTHTPRIWSTVVSETYNSAEAVRS